MNRLYIYILSIFLTGILFVSCSDDFLQRNSMTDISTDTFWKTEEHALMGLTACFDALQSKNLYSGDPWAVGVVNMDAVTDNGGHFNWSGWMPGYDLAMGIHSPSSSIFSNYWKSSYEVISRCNSLLANIDNVDMDSKEKEIIRAEAMVIRALIYCNLTSLYQDVPFPTAPQTIETSHMAKSKRSVIVDAILLDLQNASKVLPNSADRGRVTKGASLAILGRIALYNEKWDDAIKAYEEILGLGYELHDDYAGLFTTKGETSSEIIFSVRYEGPGMSEGTSFNGHWGTPIEAVNGTIDLADAFYGLDGFPTTDKKIAEPNSDGGVNLWQPNASRYENRDPRLYATLFVPGMSWNGSGGPTAWYGGAAASLSSVYVMKYFDPTDTANSWDNGQDFYVIRLPEVLLSLAEALVQKGSYTYSDVTNYIDRVRERVNMPKVEKVEGLSLSADDLMEVIKRERRVELAFESLRIFDLYRWRDMDKAIANIEKERTTYKLQYEPRRFNGEKDYVWPIPTSEMDTNEEMVQHNLWQ